MQPSPEIEARAREILCARLGARASYSAVEWADAVEQAERELLTVRAVIPRGEPDTVNGIRQT